MNPSGGSGGGYGWSPNAPRFSTPRGGFGGGGRGGHFTPRHQPQPPRHHHQPSPSGGYYQTGGNWRGGYRSNNNASYHSNTNYSSYSSANSSLDSVYHTPPTSFQRGRGAGFGSASYSGSRKRDWSTASSGGYSRGGGGSAAYNSYAKSSMLADPWASLSPVLVPEGGVAGLVAKPGQTHTFLTPRAAAEAAGELAASSSGQVSSFTSTTNNTNSSITFASFSGE